MQRTLLFFVVIVAMLFPYFSELFIKPKKSSYFENCVKVKGIRFKSLKRTLRFYQVEIYGFSWLYGSFNYVSFASKDKKAILKRLSNCSVYECE